MRRKVDKKRLWIEIIVDLILLVGAIAAFIRAETKPMSRDELKIAAANLRSLSSAGKQLTAEYLAGQTTETFLKTQSSLLQEKVSDVRKELDAANPEKGFELPHWQARHLARQTDESLTRLADDAQTAARTKGEMENLFPQLKSLEDGLKQ